MSLAGHDCVGALLVRGGKVLLGQRSEDRAWLPGAWDVFGGHIEPGETAEEALRRELAEELGVVPLRCIPLASIDSQEPGAWRLQLFVVDGWEGELRNRQPQEHSRMQWCTPTQARQHLANAHAAFAGLIECAIALASGSSRP